MQAKGGGSAGPDSEDVKRAGEGRRVAIVSKQWTSGVAICGGLAF